MKTHELAYALTQLAKLLREMPNMELGSVRLIPEGQVLISDDKSIAVNLHTLVQLSSIDKQQWITFIEEQGYKIDVRPRDASRDVLDKLLKYLEKDSEAREKLKNSIGDKASKASPELLRALSTLLKDE